MRLTLIILLSFSQLNAQTKKCLLVLVDGIPADVLENTKTPNFDAMAQKGAYARAYVGGEKGGISESPTISAVGYNSMLTGTWANKHNVWGNAIKDPNYHFPSLFKVARDTRPELKLGIFSTWEDNRTKLLGEGMELTNFLRLDYVFDGYEKDTFSFPHDKQGEYIKNIDKLVVAKAKETIQKYGPDLSWVYLEFTDDMGHKFGDSPQMTAAVEKMDKQIGQLWKAVKKREKEFNEDWLVIVTTDHGRDTTSGKNHGGQSDRERTTWIVCNKSHTNERFKTGLAIVDIFPSVLKFLELNVSTEILNQIDGEEFLN